MYNNDNDDNNDDDDDDDDAVSSSSPTTTTDLHMESTLRFYVLSSTIQNSNKNTTQQQPQPLPTLELSRLLKSCQKQKQIDNNNNNNNNALFMQVRDELLHALEDHGFVVLTLPRNSLPGRIIHDMEQSLDTDFFPLPSNNNNDDDDDDDEEERHHTNHTMEENTINPHGSHHESSHTFHDNDNENKHNNNSNNNNNSSNNKHNNTSTTKTSSSSSSSSFMGTGEVYISEKGVPMWKMGYELLDDHVREAFRVAAGIPDDVPYPSPQARHVWLRGLALCRHICDCALLLSCSLRTATTTRNNNNYNNNNDNNSMSDETVVSIKARPGSGAASWQKIQYSETPIGQLRPRPGDYSVLYAMHYFNQDTTPIVAQEEGEKDKKNKNNNSAPPIRINVKQHVDPSLFVLEPFLAKQPGLQVYSTKQKQWITCDGPESPIHTILNHNNNNNNNNDNNMNDSMMGMVLFVGKAFSAHVPTVTPTLHRVIAPPLVSSSSSTNNTTTMEQPPPNRRRTTMIYEQKYQEFFPPPSFD